MANRVVLSLIISCVSLISYACTASAPEANKNASPAPAPASPATPAASLNPLPAYNVEWVSHQVPSEMQATKWYDAEVTLKNTTTAAWPGKGTGKGYVTVAYHWLPAQGEKPVVFDGERTTLPHDIAPGETITLNKVLVIAPPNPGSYRLQISLVQEGMTWFESQGVKPLTVLVTVR